MCPVPAGGRAGTVLLRQLLPFLSELVSTPFLWQATFRSPVSIVQNSREEKEEPSNSLLCFKSVYVINSSSAKYLEFGLFSSTFSHLLLVSAVNITGLP